MMPSEAAGILAKCSAFDQRTIGEADALAWSEALQGLPPGDCLEAVSAWYRDRRERIMPSDIRASVREIRARRLKAAPSDEQLMQGVDPGNPRFFAILAERRESIAAGRVTLRAVGR